MHGNTCGLKLIITIHADLGVETDPLEMMQKCHYTDKWYIQKP